MSHLVWTKGGAADVVTVEEDAITLRSTIPSPPGSRIEGHLQVDPAVVVRVKIHGSKLVEEGAFVLRGRLLDATRELRQRLVTLATGTGDPQ